MVKGVARIIEEARRRLEGRKTFVLDKPLITKVKFSPQVYGVNADLEAMKESKRSEWIAKGYSEKLINMAFDLADEWTIAMTKAFAPPELKEAVTRHIYPKSLQVADRWLGKMG